MERSFRGVIRRSMSLAHVRPLPRDLSSSKIRKTFIDYFCEEKNHLFIRSSPVFSLLDPTLAFVNAGMNQFKDVFLGLVEPASTRVANSQKCVRIVGKHNDLSQVGQDGSHHTFFEMLGNWSFGDYFKEQACRMSWDLLTNVYGIPPERLYVTYYAGDEESSGPSPDLEVREIWRQIGVKESHILPFGMKENFWEGSLTGPCGPCTEIHYDTIPGRTEAGHLVNGNNNEVIELWNLVFTQYNRKESGMLENLRTHFVDTGMGFERLVAVLQGKANNYDTDLFTPLFQVISKHTGHSGYTGLYDGNAIDSSYRILADHSRMLAVALADGMLPKRQLRVRGVLKRVLNVSEKIFGADVNLLKELTRHVADILSDAYPEVGRNLSKIHMVIDTEVELIQAQLSTVTTQWETVLKKYPKLSDFNILESPQLLEGVNWLEKNIFEKGKTLLTGESIWILNDTYGVSPLVAQQLALKLDLTCDMESFEEKKIYEKQSNRESQQKKFSEMRNESYFLNLLTELEEKQIEPTLDYFKYDYRPDEKGEYIFKDQPTTIEAILRGNQILDEISLDEIQNGEKIGLILDRSQFFAKTNNQESDIGTLEIEKEIIFKINSVIKVKNFVIHYGTFKTFPSGTKVSSKDIGTLKLNKDKRLNIMRNHTALHLLNSALRNILPVALEKCSNVGPRVLTLDFLVNESTLHPVNSIIEIEKYVKEFILHGVSVKRTIMNHKQFQEADDIIFIPGEQIVGLEIPVIEINSGFKISKEYCTGTHILNTSDLKDFIVTKFRKGSHGIQTIQAVTGTNCRGVRNNDIQMQTEWTELSKELDQCKTLTKCSEIFSKLSKLQSDVGNHTMSHILRLKLETEIQSALNALKFTKRALIAKEIEEALDATSEMFVIYLLKTNFELNNYDFVHVKKLLKKPFMLVYQRENLCKIYSSVPKKFITKSFSAEKWLLDTIAPFGGTVYHEQSVNPHVWCCLQEREFSKEQIDELSEIASDLAKKNIKS